MVSRPEVSLGSVTKGNRYTNRRAENSLRQMSSPTGVIVEYHVLRALKEQGLPLSPEVDNKSCYNPDQMWLNLAKYGRTTDFRPNMRIWRAAWKLTKQAFGGQGDLQPLEGKDDLKAAIKEEKSSGAPLFTDKGSAFERDFARMERFSLGEISAQPCIAFHRVQHGEKGPKTRLVWGYPLHMTLLEAKFARPLIEKFLGTRTPMAFGLHRHELAARMLPITNSGLRYGFDFSAFDTSIHPKLLNEAFIVLKSHFVKVNQLEWDRMVHYFIHTPILMPDGFIYKVHKGVPSGSYFTQMVDSIINFFAVQYSALKLAEKPIRGEKVLVLGDDGLVGLDKWIPLERWAGCFADLGLNISTVKSELTRFGDPISFLGHTWKDGLVDRLPIELAKRMAFPEKPLRIDDVRLRIVTRILAYGSDALSAHLIIARWSRYKGPDVRSIYFRDTLTTPMMGWREFQLGDRPVGNLPDGALNQIYVGLLV